MSNSRTFEDALDEQLSIIRETLLRKRAAYGSSNLVTFGELGILVRAFDKMHRLKNLHQSGKNPAEEPIDESWLDMIGYSILARIYRNGELELPDAKSDSEITTHKWGGSDYAPTHWKVNSEGFTKLDEAPVWHATDAPTNRGVIFVEDGDGPEIQR